MKSVLICDDHGLMRDALAMMLANLFPGVRIETARDYPTAFEKLAERFDLCVTDYVMPGSEPYAGISAMLAKQPDMPFVVISGQGDAKTISDLVDLGIAGVIPKSLDAKVVEAAINLVLAGGRYLPPQVAELAASRRLATDVALTNQQIKVLEHLVEGKTNKEIAKSLGVAPSTINFHVDSILERLDARNRSEACAKFIVMRERGLP
jgi:two-component system, NarL family, nitrate/nitrite response regulator NarL